MDSECALVHSLSGSLCHSRLSPEKNRRRFFSPTIFFPGRGGCDTGYLFGGVLCDIPLRRGKAELHRSRPEYFRSAQREKFQNGLIVAQNYELALNER